MLERLAEIRQMWGRPIGAGATLLNANPAILSIVREGVGGCCETFVKGSTTTSGVKNPTRADWVRFERKRKRKNTSNQE